MTPRLTSRVQVSALVRLAEADGGTGAVVVRGDPDRGTVLVLLSERGVPRRLLGRALVGDKGYDWTVTGPQDVGDQPALNAYLSRRRANDSDLWVVELDVADAERFAAQLATVG